MNALRLTPLLTLLFACGKDDGPANDSAPASICLPVLDVRTQSVFVACYVQDFPCNLVNCS